MITPVLLGLTSFAAAAPAATGHAQLVRLFGDWRHSTIRQLSAGGPIIRPRRCPPRRRACPQFRRRLEAIDRAGWSASQLGDYRFVEAEMNGLDFFLRVLALGARSGFYQTIFAEMSDVPAHEGPSAEPNIDLHNFTYPLSAADDARLTELLRAVPAMLADAKVNLAGSQAHDLWAFGDRAFLEQAEALAGLEAGTLVMTTLAGSGGHLEGATPGLRAAVHQARLASEEFARWIKVEAPRRTGPSGVGKTNYDWYLKHVLLSP